MRRRQQPATRGARGARRAAFPQEAVMDNRAGYAAWEAAPPAQAVYGTPPGQEAQQDPWQAGFVQAEEAWLFDEPAAAAAYGGEYIGAGQHEAWRETPKARSAPAVAALLASLALILFCLVSIYQASSREAGFQAKMNAMKGQAFFSGIYIDDQPVAGLAPGALRQAAGSGAAAADPQLDIRLTIDSTGYRFNNSHIPFQRNLEQVMEQAFAIGRQVNARPDGLGLTPFELRYQTMRQAQAKKAYFYSEVSYSRPLVEALAEQLAAQTNRDPVNAVVSSFDFSTKRFTVTQDTKGRQIAAKDIADALYSALDSRDYQADIRLQSAAILPRVSSVDLQNSFTMLASFSTKTTSNEDRNHNIALAAQAISNTTLMPGEIFSFNQATGQRTIQKGYRGAPAIQGGVLIDDVGGGVCQVSSTLFYAAASAGMAIVERSPHAWPVSYMDKGLDATVNWPNLDFKFKNDKETPVFIIASYAKRSLTIEFYGMLGSPGETIRLEAQLLSTTQPPREPLMVPNPSLPPNTQQELKQARTGYVVDTWRVYLRNGVEFHREKLFTSRYREVQQVIEYN